MAESSRVSQRSYYGELVKLINEIYTGVAAETLVIFDYASQLQKPDDQFWLHMEQPKVLVTSMSKKPHLREHFNSQILSVAIMASREWTQEQWQHFENVLRRFTHTDVVFVRNVWNTTEDEAKLNFFKFCWQKRFLRVLVTSWDVQLALTYTPFPRITPKTTSPSIYLKERRDPEDFQGYTIRVSAGNNPPRALVYYNKHKELKYDGMVPRLLTILAQRYNLTVNWVLMPNFEKYAIADCLKSLLADQIDFCADYLPFNENAYVIAQPVYISYGYIQVPFAQTIPKYRYFLQPFNKDLWLTIILLLLFTTLGLSLIRRVKLGVWQLGKFFLLSLQIIANISYTLPPRRGLQNPFIYVTLIVCGFILSNMYVAFLSSILTANVYESQIDSIHELKRRKIPVLINDMDIEVLHMFESFKPIADNYLKVDIPTYHSHRRLLDPRFAYISFEDKSEFYLYQQKFMQRPLLRMMSQPLAALWANIPMRLNSPFQTLLNHYMLTMFDTGLIRHLQEQTKEESIQLGLIDFFKTARPDVLPLSTEYFQMPAMLLAVGYLSSTLCFIGENILYRLRLESGTSRISTAA